jgi:translation elongation factor EF-Ts
MQLLFSLHAGMWCRACLVAVTQAVSESGLSGADAKAAAQELAGKLAMHVVAMRPPYLSRETGVNAID